LAFGSGEAAKKLWTDLHAQTHSLWSAWCRAVFEQHGPAKNMKDILLLILSSVVLVGCNVSSPPTNYGDTDKECSHGTLNANIVAQAITVTTGGTLKSISVYCTSNGGGNIQVGNL
jgi:hypothetical protein